jgi:hypothetical protein
MGNILEDLGIVNANGQRINKSPEKENAISLESEGIATSEDTSLEPQVAKSTDIVETTEPVKKSGDILQLLGITNESGNRTEKIIEESVDTSLLPITDESQVEKEIEHDESGFAYGFSKTKPDYLVWNMWLETLHSQDVTDFGLGTHNEKYSKPVPEDFWKNNDRRTPQQMYGYDTPMMPRWDEMSSHAKGIRLLEIFNANIAREFPNLSKDEHEKKLSQWAGEFLGYAASPTSALPLGQKWKSIIGIGFGLGAEYGMAEGLLETGGVDWNRTIEYGMGGAIIAPALVLGGRFAVRQYKKFKAKRLVRKQAKSAEEFMQHYEELVFSAVANDVPTADIFTFINHSLGIDEHFVAEMARTAGIKNSKGVIEPYQIRLPSKQTAIDWFQYKNTVEGKTGTPWKEGGWIEDLFGVISTRVKMINVRLWHRLREVDKNQHVNVADTFKEVEPFLKFTKNLKKGDKEFIHTALYNGDFARIEAVLKGKAKGKNKQAYVDALESFRVTRKVLERLHKEAKDAGLNLGYLENYFPRNIKPGQLNALLKHLDYKQRSALDMLLLRARVKKGGRDAKNNPIEAELTDEEIGNVINKFLLGEFPTGSGTSKLRHQRKINEITKDLLQFYDSPEVSLHVYITRVVTEIERVKFFGTAWHPNTLKSGTDVEKSIGALIAEQRNTGKKISEEQLKELSKLLKARFGPGEMSPNRFIQDFKNINYMMLLGNPWATATQLSDTLFAAYKTGDFMSTLKAVLTERNIKIEDLGLRDVGEELVSNRWTADRMRDAFKYSFFSTIDRFGKEGILNGAFIKYSKQIQTDEGLNAFTKKWFPAFEDDLGELIQALKRGDNNNKQVKMLLWHELADMQPISLSEMPYRYLQHPAGRTLYMLKTFTIKQMDIMRRDAFQLMKAKKQVIKNGKPVWVADTAKQKEGAANLLRYATYFTVGGMGSSYVKDWMSGREYDVSDEFVESMWKLVGFNRYAADRLFSSGDIIAAGSSVVSIPTENISNILYDIGAVTGFSNAMMDAIYTGEEHEIEPNWKSVKGLPLIGKALWYKILGVEYEDERAKRLDKKKPNIFEEMSDKMFNKIGRIIGVPNLAEGGLVSQMQRLRFANGGTVPQMQRLGFAAGKKKEHRLGFAEGGRVGPNPLIKRILDYNTVASDEESEAFFNTPDYKDKGYYSEVRDGKIYINSKALESGGSKGDYKKDITLFDSMHNLKHSAPEWYDRLYTAANTDPAVIQWKENLFADAQKAGERRTKEDWWNESQFDQIVAGYLFADKDANIHTMREWSKDDKRFGTKLRKELEAFEKALGRGKRESFMDRGIDYIKSIGEKIDRKGDEIKKDLHWTGFKERSSFLQHMLVDAPIELLKKYVPGIDDKTFEYTEVPPKQESQWTTEYIQSFKEMSIPERMAFLKNLQLNKGQDFEVFRKNLAPSIRDLNKALIHMAAHPVETVDALLDLTAGGIANLLPDNWADTIDDIAVSFGFASHKPQQEMASAFGHMIKDEYGSLEKFRESALGNPAQTMFDMWIAGSLAKLGIKTAMKKMPRTVDDITPDMQSKFVTAIQKMELPIERVLDKGVLGVSLHGPKSYIFPPKEGRHLTGKQKEIEALRKEARNFETAEEFIGSKFANDIEVGGVLKKKINVNELERLKGGSARNVYKISDDKVVKVAKTARGLEQNYLATDSYLRNNEHFPKVFETGKDYVVAEYVPRNDKVVRQFLKPLLEFNAVDFRNKTSELQEAMVEMGLDDFMNYDLLWNDFIAYRNWGVRADGTPVLVDEGALVDSITRTSKIDDMVKKEWNEVKELRKNAGEPEIVISQLTSIWEGVQGKQEVVSNIGKTIESDMYIATNTEMKKYFGEIARQQRGKAISPERTMKKLMDLNPGVMGGVLEHGGDLLWRMTHTAPTMFDSADVLKKSKYVLSSLNSKVFHKEFLENIHNNEVSKDMSKYEFVQLLEDYGKQHSELPVYNYAQYLAREIPVQLIEDALTMKNLSRGFSVEQGFNTNLFNKYDDLISKEGLPQYEKTKKLLGKMIFLVHSGKFRNEVTQIKKDADGNPIQYTKEDFLNREKETKQSKKDKALEAKALKEKEKSKKILAKSSDYGMYSQLEETILNLRQEGGQAKDTFNPKYVINQFKKNAVTANEMNDSGMLAFLQQRIKDKKPVTREELMKQFEKGSLINTLDIKTLTYQGINKKFALTSEEEILDARFPNRSRDGGENPWIALKYQSGERPSFVSNAEHNGRVIEADSFDSEIHARSLLILEEILNGKIFDIGSDFNRHDHIMGNNRDLQYVLHTIDPIKYPEPKLAGDFSKDTPTIFLIDKAIKEASKENPPNKEIVNLKKDIKKGEIDIGTFKEFTDSKTLKLLEADRNALERRENVYMGVLSQKVKQKLPDDLVTDLEKAAMKMSTKIYEDRPKFEWILNSESKGADGKAEFTYRIFGNHNDGFEITKWDNIKNKRAEDANLPPDEAATGSARVTSLNEAQVHLSVWETAQGLGDAPGTAKWSQYISPGDVDLATYKETLIALGSPSGVPFKGGHWGLENNLMHLRSTHRVDVEGNKAFHIEELQPDWLEAGEKKGWQIPGSIEKFETNYAKINDKSLALVTDLLPKFQAALYKKFPDIEANGGTNFRNFLDKFRASGLPQTEQARKLLNWIYQSKKEWENRFSGPQPVGDLIDILKRKSGIRPSNIRSVEAYGMSSDGITTLANFHYLLSKISEVNSKTHPDYKVGMTVENELYKTFVEPFSRKESANILSKMKNISTRLTAQRRAIPPMPMALNDKWIQFGMNRAIKEAIEEGRDRISWANSSDQVAHWDVGRQTKQVPEGVNKRMFTILYDNKMPGYAKRLSEQYNADFGKTKYDGMGSITTDSQLNSRYYLEISPELKEAIETGRLKFYKRGGLVKKNTYRRGGLVSHNVYRKNMSRLGFQEGRYAQ